MRLNDLFKLQDIDNKDLFEENEIQANKLVAIIDLFIGLIAVLAIILNIFHVLGLLERQLIIFGVSAAAFCFIPFFVCKAKNGSGKWLKYYLMISLIICIAGFDSVLGMNAAICLPLPIIISCRYYSVDLSKRAAILAIIAYIIAEYIYCAYPPNDLALEYVWVKPDDVFTVYGNIYKAIFEIGPEHFGYRRSYMFAGCGMKVLFLCPLAFLSCRIAKKGREMVLEQADISTKNARIESELDLARNIQADMLPSEFPPFPDCSEFDIYATMTPAKEVAGDFYDFIMPDKDHVAFIMADVSGKGVPASLFMMTTKTLVKKYLQMGYSPAEVFKNVNIDLLENNDYGFFVTSWLGLLDIRTGILTYVNAGHTAPLISHNGRFEYLRSKPDLVLACMDGVNYKENTLTLSPGDRVFIYTDGVTEATSTSEELYGEERLINFVNEHPDMGLKETLEGVRSDIDSFVGEAEQFDDITMLLLKYLA